MSTTPYQGVTLRRLENGSAVLRIHYTADPTMTPQRVATLRQSYLSEATWRREMEIEYEALEGERLFPVYAPQYNDVEPFDCTDPRYWTWYMGCDPHGRTPHGFVWVAFGSSGDIVVAQELFRFPHVTVKEYAETIKWLESDSDDKPAYWWPGQKLSIYKRIMDTHGKGINSDEGDDYFRAYRRHGLNFYSARKGQDINEVARSEINRKMKPQRVEGVRGVEYIPEMYVSTVCVNCREQLENVRFPSGEVESLSDEKPETFVRHIVDPLTYIFSDRPRFVDRGRYVNQEEPIYANTGY